MPVTEQPRSFRSASSKVTPDNPAAWRHKPANKRWDLVASAYTVEFAGPWEQAKARLVTKRLNRQRAAVVMNLDSGAFELRVPKGKSK